MNGCRAPEGKCNDTFDCYSAKQCQYWPREQTDDSEAPTLGEIGSAPDGVVFLEPTAADLAPFAAYRETIEAPPNDDKISEAISTPGAMR